MFSHSNWFYKVWYRRTRRESINWESGGWRGCCMCWDKETQTPWVTAWGVTNPCDVSVCNFFVPMCLSICLYVNNHHHHHHHTPCVKFSYHGPPSHKITRVSGHVCLYWQCSQTRQVCICFPLVLFSSTLLYRIMHSSWLIIKCTQPHLFFSSSCNATDMAKSSLMPWEG